MDNRIAAVARAHAGIGPSSPDLPALYTLGGRFDGAAVTAMLKAMGQGGGTSCVMTARAIYHAAGCDMIDGSEPAINTPTARRSISARRPRRPARCRTPRSSGCRRRH